MVNNNTVYENSLKDIQISQFNVGQSNPTRDLDQLASSIDAHGLLQPVGRAGAYGLGFEQAPTVYFDFVTAIRALARN